MFGLTGSDLTNPELLNIAIRNLGTHMPRYIILKGVKKRWGTAAYTATGHAGGGAPVGPKPALSKVFGIGGRLISGSDERMPS